VNKLAVIVLLAGLSACSKKKPEEGREPVQTATPGAVVGSAAPSGAAPAGSSAGAPAGTAGPAPGGAAPAAPAADVACASTTTLTCDAGQRDGCADGLTTVHACVPGDAKAGAPCAQPGPACPAGQVDACRNDPPRSINHVCVVVPKPTP
jgi:hypothetical protein